MKKFFKILLFIIASFMILFGSYIAARPLADLWISVQEARELDDAFNKTVIIAETNKEPVFTKEDSAYVEDDYEEKRKQREEEYLKHREEIKKNATFTGRQMVCKIEIPSVEISDVVIEGTDLSAISYALGHFEETVWPGEEGNFAVCGHRGGKHGKFFKYLPDVELGEIIYVTDIYGDEYKYEVVDKYIIDPDEFWVLDNETNGTKVITLITCANSGTQRYVIKGEIK